MYVTVFYSVFCLAVVCVIVGDTSIDYITPPVLTFSFVIKLVNLLISKCHLLNLYLVSSLQACY